MKSECSIEFKRRMNGSWKFQDVLSDDPNRRNDAIVHALQVGADLWSAGCHCTDCRDAYLGLVRSLVECCTESQSSAAPLVHVLWWKYRDNSAQDVVRVYADLKRAESDTALFGEYSHVDWRITSLPLT